MPLLSACSILIVEDHEPMRMLIARTLRSAGVSRLREADSAEAALAMLDTERAELILVDKSMPGLGGVHLIKTIRADFARYGAPRIVMITGDGNAPNTHDAADAVLVKPISPRELLAALDRLAL